MEEQEQIEQFKEEVKRTYREDRIILYTKDKKRKYKRYSQIKADSRLVFEEKESGGFSIWIKKNSKSDQLVEMFVPYDEFVDIQHIGNKANRTLFKMRT